MRTKPLFPKNNGVGCTAHAGESILDVDAPGFRGATLTGVVIGVLLFFVVAAIGLRTAVAARR